MAVTAFVLGLLGITAIPGVVLGIIALRRIRTTLQLGRGLAIAGIALGSAWLAVSAVVVATGVILRTVTPAQPSASASTHPGDQGVLASSLAAGDHQLHHPQPGVHHEVVGPAGLADVRPDRPGAPLPLM